MNSELCIKPITDVSAAIDRFGKTLFTRDPNRHDQIKRALQSFNYQDTSYLDVQSNGVSVGCIVINKYPNAWEIPFFHLIDQSTAEQTIPMLLNLLHQQFINMQKYRSFYPQTIKIRFPLVLLDPKWSSLMFIQRGYQAYNRIEMRVKLQKCYQSCQMKLQSYKTNNYQSISDINLITYTPILKEQFIQIGHACIEETDDCILFYNDYFSSYTSYTKHINDMIQSQQSKIVPELCFLVLYKGHLVGMLMSVELENEIYISELGILPTYRNKGLATEVLKQFTERAIKKDYTQMSLSLVTSNKNAFRFYRSIGCKENKHQLWYVKKLAQ